MQVAALEPNAPFTVLAYATLGVSVLVALSGNARLQRGGLIGLGMSLGLGLAGGLLAFSALLPVAILLVFGGLWRKWAVVSGQAERRLGAWVCLAVGVVTSLSLALHQWPGFNNVRIVADQVLSPGALPYTLYLSYDKALAGLFLLILLIDPAPRRVSLSTMLRISLPLAGLWILVLMSLAMVLGYVTWAPKWAGFFPVWMLANLLITCTAEEAFFRGLIQQHLARLLTTRVPAGPVVAVVLSAVLFGFAHIGGGWTYVLLACVAGLGYGWVYQRTGRIEAAILVHFLVNLAHITLFTYPALSR